MLQKLMLTQKPWQKLVVQGVIFILVCLATLGFLLCCAGLIIVKIDTPQYVLVPITTGLLTFASFLDSFLLARLFKENGMLIGMITGVIMVLIVLISAFCMGTFAITNVFITKTLAILFAGAIGGILGVNSK